MAEKIMTLHPEEGKSGVNISRPKYAVVKEAILETIGAQEDITFSGLTAAIEEKLEGKFEGSIPWYVTTVKLDLEARGIIERVPKTHPQQLQLAGK